MASRMLARRLLTGAISRSSGPSVAQFRLASVPLQREFSSKPLIPGVGLGKTSTGLVGLAVDHEAVPKMIVKYQAILDKLAASDMPEDAQYRINVEAIARYRIKAAQENLEDPEMVEELCNCGQVEELVIQADQEMGVVDMYIRERWWELIKPVDVEYNPDPADDDYTEPPTEKA
eukprot:CAMPEP_0198304318 /NCGR_PEP_ID=MMETSP1449-20131203/57337_1 /TAXON_ID=420275 /ORGANISM="Attheya septentrionalis, Strain CCMP2084" /LENGTH=174 /DNA_ID=CAMNT_0044006839 /DNA_START=443 /DNA_END=967 /DNA_ORIENTATION=+